MKSVIINKEIKKTSFKIEELVISKETGMVVLCSKNSISEERTFCGTVIVKGKNLSTLGEYSELWDKCNFETFSGNIELTQ